MKRILWLAATLVLALSSVVVMAAGGNMPADKEINQLIRCN